jgi:hypothetical protein
MIRPNSESTAPMMLFWSTVLSWVITTLAMLWAARLTSVEVSLSQAAMVCAVTNLTELIPYVGWPLAVLITLGALKRITQERVWPTLVILAGTALVCTIVIAMAFGALSGAFG